MQALSRTPVLAFSAHPPTKLDVYRWTSPQTDCPYPYLAAARDCSTSLLLGCYEACFEIVPSGETRRWLPDFTATRGRLPLDLTGLCELVEHVCAGGVDCGIVQFDTELRVSGLKLVLAGDGEDVEYVIHAFGRYERWERSRDSLCSVSAAERALLHVCCAMFTALARRVPELLREPPPLARSVKTLVNPERMAGAAVRSR